VAILATPSLDQSQLLRMGRTLEGDGRGVLTHLIMVSASGLGDTEIPRAIARSWLVAAMTIVC
jgi:hypothetical protein